MRGIFSTLAIVWRIASPYFRSEDRWPGRILLAAVIAIELSIVGITVLLNEWNARFYNALQDRNWNAFVYQLGYFCVLATAFILLAVYQLYLNQWLQIRWRRWLTASYLDHWLEGANHYRMQLLGDAADNPDQRIAEDIGQFIELDARSIGLQLLNSCVTLFSFMIILWALSAAAPLHVFGISFNIPGYLLWAALIYACIGTALTHLIGRPLIALNFQQQRYEADFRFNLVRVRENSEQIALLDGERGRARPPADAIRQCRRQLARDHVAAEEAHLLHRQLCAGLRGVPVRHGEPGLFRQRDPARRADADRERLRAGAGRAVGVREPVPQSRRMERGDRAPVRLRSVGGGRPRGRGDAAGDRRRAGRGGSGLVQGSGGAAAERRAAGQRQRHLDSAGRAGAGERPVRRRQVDAVPGAGRHLAVRRRHDHGAEKCPADDPAAAALLSDRALGRRGRLSGGARQLSMPPRSPSSSPRSACRPWPPGSRRRRIGTACCRSASSSGSASPARSCMRRTICSWTRPPPRSTSRPRPRSTICCEQRLPAATIVSIGHRSTLAAFHRRRLAFSREGDRFWVREGSLAPVA